MLLGESICTQCRTCNGTSLTDEDHHAATCWGFQHVDNLLLVFLNCLILVFEKTNGLQLEHVTSERQKLLPPLSSSPSREAEGRDMNQMDERGLSLAAIDPFAPGMIQDSFAAAVSVCERARVCVCAVCFSSFLPSVRYIHKGFQKTLAHSLAHLVWSGCDAMLSLGMNLFQ